MALQVLFYVGAGKSELAGLRLRDYNVEARELTLTGKGGKVRTVPVSVSVLRFDLEAHLTARLNDGGDRDEYTALPRTPRAVG